MFLRAMFSIGLSRRDFHRSHTRERPPRDVQNYLMTRAEAQRSMRCAKRIAWRDRYEMTYYRSIPKLYGTCEGYGNQLHRLLAHTDRQLEGKAA